MDIIQPQPYYIKGILHTIYHNVTVAIIIHFVVSFSCMSVDDDHAYCHCGQTQLCINHWHKNQGGWRAEQNIGAHKGSTYSITRNYLFFFIHGSIQLYEVG